MNFIPSPRNLSARIRYYGEIWNLRIVGYIPSTDGFLSHTTIVFEKTTEYGRNRGQTRFIKRLEQSVNDWTEHFTPNLDDGGFDETIVNEEGIVVAQYHPNNGGLLNALGVI